MDSTACLGRGSTGSLSTPRGDLGFTRSARELGVTQAAVSHQIRALESELGQALFIRRTRALALTDVGRSYLPALATRSMRWRKRRRSPVAGRCCGATSVSSIRRICRAGGCCTTTG
ncbi:MAG TPA: LysR family transcriptional regulator, partial [Polyangiales bacterium]|nr:LysR family transcriptional regulator [Polyangiales bacterium]